MKWSRSLREVHFQDESREIASEYRGGLARYAALGDISPPRTRTDGASEDFNLGTTPSTASYTQPTLPPILPFPETYNDNSHETFRETQHHQHSNSDGSISTYQSNAPPAPGSSYSNPDQMMTPPHETRDFLNQQEETLFMQVFVEEVGLWMDSLDPMKHVSFSGPVAVKNLLTLSSSRAYSLSMH